MYIKIDIGTVTALYAGWVVYVLLSFFLTSANELENRATCTSNQIYR